MIRFLGQRHIRPESDQKDKMRHTMDDKGIAPSTEIYERHRERALTTRMPDDTNQSIRSKISNGPMNRGLSLPLIPKRLTPLNGETFRNTRSPT
ncbi:hypothetical protein Tco_0066398 [Tanacetum coccineum]